MPRSALTSSACWCLSPTFLKYFIRHCLTRIWKHGEVSAKQTYVPSFLAACGVHREMAMGACEGPSPDCQEGIGGSVLGFTPCGFPLWKCRKSFGLGGPLVSSGLWRLVMV